MNAVETVNKIGTESEQEIEIEGPLPAVDIVSQDLDF